MSGEVRITALTHRGAVRDSNEDALTLGAITVSTDTRPVHVTIPVSDPVVLAVADGLGGHVAGEIASEHVARRLSEVGNTLTGPGQLTELLHHLNEELQDHAGRYDEFTGMGTTVAGLLLLEGKAWWFNVGDSRTYRLEGHHLVQLTEDDSPPLPAGEGSRPVTTNFITQSLGGSLKGQVVPHVGEAPAGTGVWLLCSDGLSDLVSSEEMERILADATCDEAAVHALWQAAMQAGGKDNISIILARS